MTEVTTDYPTNHSDQDEEDFINPVGSKLQGKDFALHEMPVKRLVFLMIVTFGVYDLFWMYKNWQQMNEALPQNSKVSPLARTIFDIFFMYSLFWQMLSAAKAKGFAASYSAAGLTTIYILSYVSLGYGGSIETVDYWRVAILFLGLALRTTSLALAQQAANHNNAKLPKNLRPADGISRGEWICIVIFTIIGLTDYFTTFVPVTSLIK